jgi:hypothetical protein
MRSPAAATPASPREYAVSDFGSEAGAAIRPCVRSGAVNVAIFNAVTWAYATWGQPCSGGGGVRDEETESSEFSQPDSGAEGSAAIIGSALLIL